MPDQPPYLPPLMDPQTTFDNIPEGWRVLWCAGCLYAVTWADADVDDSPEREWGRDVADASAHDCLAQNAPSVMVHSDTDKQEAT